MKHETILVPVKCSPETNPEIGGLYSTNLGRLRFKRDLGWFEIRIHPRQKYPNTWYNEQHDKIVLDAPKDYFKITGFETMQELSAYEKGRRHEEITIVEFIKEWNGETNSILGAILNNKLIKTNE